MSQNSKYKNYMHGGKGTECVHSDGDLMVPSSERPTPSVVEGVLRCSPISIFISMGPHILDTVLWPQV